MSLEIFLIDFENVQPAGIGRLKPGDCKIRLFLGQNQSKAPVELVRALQPFGADVDYLTISGSGPNAVDFHIAFYIGRLAVIHPGAQFSIVSGDTGFDPLVSHLKTLGIACRRIAGLPGGPLVTRATVATKQAAPAIKMASPGIETKSIAAAPAVAAKAAAPKAAPPRKAMPARTTNVQVTVLPDVGPRPALKEAPPIPPEMMRIIESAIERLKGLKSGKPAKLKTLESSLSLWSKPPLDAKKVALVLANLQHRKLLAVEGTKVIYRLG